MTFLAPEQLKLNESYSILNALSQKVKRTQFYSRHKDMTDSMKMNSLLMISPTGIFKSAYTRTEFFAISLTLVALHNFCRSVQSLVSCLDATNTSTEP